MTPGPANGDPSARTLRGYKEIADALHEARGFWPCERTLKRYSSRRSRHNPLPLHRDLGNVVAITLGDLLAWADREIARLNPSR